jgi:hypothetical protein
MVPTEIDDPVLTNLLERSAELRVARVKAEREFLHSRGERETLTKEQQAALEKKRQEVLYQLELEGADIEREFTEKYRARLAGLGNRFPGLGGGGLSLGCHIACESCITSSCLTCVACASCISPCTNAIF